MQEQHTADDQSHYEISLTAGQAFVAFVLLLLSLAASFAFGLLLGRGQADERLVVRRETPVVTEASALPRKNAGEIVELGVSADDFAEESQPAETTSSAAVIEEQPAPVADTAPPAQPGGAAGTQPAEISSNAGQTRRSVAEAANAPQASPPQATAPQVTEPQAAAPPIPHFAQLLSTGDQKAAEALAVKLIERGYGTAYVQRGATDKGPVFRVRVRFPSEQEARAAEPKLREFSREVWITAK